MEEEHKIEPTTDYSKPVAYDTNGNPLYAHPPANPSLASKLKAELQTHAVRMMRPIILDPAPGGHSEETIKMKHDRSKRTWPTLSLSEGEFVIRMIPRSLIGLTGHVSISLFLITLSFIALLNYDLIAASFNVQQQIIDPQTIIFSAIIVICLTALAMYIIYYIYTSNKLFLTNESVIQEIQTGLFSKKEQIVSLVNIEDVSYSQEGILQQIFNFGSIRLSTEGEETTYTFTYASNPKVNIATLNNAVEAFKNGRHVTGD
jgi:membrane protein YdbS with pleckstrin-like domain